MVPHYPRPSISPDMYLTVFTLELIMIMLADDNDDDNIESNNL